MYNLFDPLTAVQTRYIFFTGKGGVGKTSTACATAVTLADAGRKVLLVSTDPASNLQDVFGMELSNSPATVKDAANLDAANLDPEKAALEYKEKVVAPYRGVLPDAVLASMEEQLSGACTVEIAAFDEFTAILTNESLREHYDHILFDTAPTGHTLRLLQLPTSWNGFLEEAAHGASCLGPLAGLDQKKHLYEQAVQTLSDLSKTTIILVARPERTPLLEAARASCELQELGVGNQVLIINGILDKSETEDQLASVLYNRQQLALKDMPEMLKQRRIFQVRLAPFNVLGTDKMRQLFNWSGLPVSESTFTNEKPLGQPLAALIQDIEQAGTRILFTMGKGGVGKTTVASALAVGLAERGHKVHLSTTDPAAHLEMVFGQEAGLVTLSRIDPKEEVERYRQEVLRQNEDMLDEEGLRYLEEDLKSPCTEEIAVFRAFANLVERSRDEIVVIDTAPTGHTLLLLDASEEYHKEIMRSTAAVPESVRQLLPKLRNPKETGVIIVTLAEATPFYEASRLERDLGRAGIAVKWWVISQSFAAAETHSSLLKGRALAEREWIEKVQEASTGHTAIIPWKATEISGYEPLKDLITGD
ncbi:arsenical pump-driving ATPase [Paenibacillus rhizophilus]|uniref:Arsenical pump-driving ATPase n=1 Tax=Paenibacillus rhizophilus TaxID=1850366 RepID=A0A3N9Q460_9BACL|nr:arsenical pump-driving ATPase [Paenibacillus rhizophilus]RQW13542.1 arsenical pump-driving ATPase [Paenibacillus rhizophilus]